MEGAFSLAQACGEESIKNLEALKTNAGDNFMKGLPANPYEQAKAQVNQVNAAVQTGIDNIQGNWDNMAAAWEDFDSEALKDMLVNGIYNYVVDDLKAYEKQKTQEFIQKVGTYPAFLAQRTAYWYSVYIQEEIQKAVDDFYNDKAASNKAAQEAQDEKEVKEQLTNIKNKVQDVAGIVASGSQLIYKNVMSITSTLSAGPQLIEQNAQKMIDKTLQPMKNELDKLMDKGYEEGLKFFDSKAKKAGKFLADKTAKATRDLTKKALTLADKVKKKAISFAKSALELVTQKAKAMAGL